jgi:inner membrane protein
MTGNTHAVCGVGVMGYLMLTHLEDIVMLNQPADPALTSISAFAAVGAAFVGSYMPDIDIEQSKMGKKAGIVSKLLTHRGITHTLVVPALLAVLIWWLLSQSIQFFPTVVLGFGVGWLAHIAADMFNSKGVPILWPLTNAHISLASFKTRTWHEFVFLILWNGGLVACYLLL